MRRRRPARSCPTHGIFGDGTSGTGSRPTHSYAVAGIYNVTLTLTDTHGVQASSPPQPVGVIIAPDPVASFTVSPGNPAVSDDVHFDGSLSTVPAGRSIDGFDWDFGDGSFGSGKNVMHKFGKAFTYTIVLTVTDSTGRKGVASKSLQVADTSPRKVTERGASGVRHCDLFPCRTVPLRSVDARLDRTAEEDRGALRGSAARRLRYLVADQPEVSQWLRWLNRPARLRASRPLSHH